MMDKFFKMFKNSNNAGKTERTLTHHKLEEPYIEFIRAQLIEGIYDRDNEYFWDHHGCKKSDYIALAKKSKILYEKFSAGIPLEKLKCDPECEGFYGAYLGDKCIVNVEKREGKYLLVDDGRHRVAAAQELDLYIPVKIIGEYL